jgi:hypothetical protein
MTKWWKSDLQVATPAWRFTLPTGMGFDLATDAGRVAFGDEYMRSLQLRGIELVALADHNSPEWIDTMVAAGQRSGIAVFPGCEVTTGSGADGIHLLVIGGPDKTGADFDRLLAGPLGYQAPDNPRFHQRQAGREPGSSGKTLVQILDDLPDEYIAIAPHVFGDNGLVSAESAKGDIRWKALHHHRLNALDAGDCSDPSSQSWNDRFRRRELDDFPRLEEVAFVSTSDAYSMEGLGSRFTWIRMEEPSIEALRQAFLDREARILCDWDARLNEYPDRDPNRIQHAWVQRIELLGPLGNSTLPISLDFDPRLNVLIGGRGSGKSTIITALRLLYSGFATLPNGIRSESQKFASEVFDSSDLTASHRIQNSQDSQVARWTAKSGSTTDAEGTTVPTAFRVRVVNQKELFARVSHDREDQFGPSRSLLAFADEGLGLLRTNQPAADSWWRRYEDSQGTWMSLARQHRTLRDDVSQLPALRARIRELNAQVEAFDAPEARARRERNDTIIGQQGALESQDADLQRLLEGARKLVEPAEQVNQETPAATAWSTFLDITNDFRDAVLTAVDRAETALHSWRDQLPESDWGIQVAAARTDADAYIAELVEKGIDPAAYSEVREQLARQQGLERSLTKKESDLEVVLARKTAAWARIVELQQERRQQRTRLFDDVEARSKRLRFALRAHRDRTGWTAAVRELLNLRADSFLEDVPRLAEWLWDDEGRLERWQRWREALINGDFGDLALVPEYPIRIGWQRKLEQLDETLRLRLAVEIADDTLEMQFLKDRGDPERDADWQDITQGSPGQRTAAMLAFVLHHGNEPLVLDQPEDDLDTEWISKLVVRELRASRSKRQIIVASHNANIPVNGDAERVLVLENDGGALKLRRTEGPDGALHDHAGAIEVHRVREDIQNIMEGGIRAFVLREKKYNNEVRETAGWFAQHAITGRAVASVDERSDDSGSDGS